MAEDRRTYQLIQNSRHGRVIATRSEKIDTMVEAITAYVARRLIEREKALASDATVEDAARALLQKQAAEAPAQTAPAQPPAAKDALEAAPVQGIAPPLQANAPARRRPLFEFLMFIAEFIGFAVLIVLLLGAAYFLWNLGEAWWVARFSRSG